jgi:chromosome segregation ATPase
MRFDNDNIRSAVSDLEDADAEYRDLVSLNSDYESQIADLTRERDALRNDFHEAEDALDTALSENRRLTAEIAELHEALLAVQEA